MKQARNLWMIPVLLLAACSMGPSPPQVVGRRRAPIGVNSVSVYFSRCAPASYRTVAKMDASKLGGFSSWDFNRRWIELLREQAAALGADGLLLIPVGRASMVGVSRSGPGFRAEAIWDRSMLAPPPGTRPWPASCAAEAKLLRYDVSHPPMAGPQAVPPRQ